MGDLDLDPDYGLDLFGPTTTSKAPYTEADAYASNGTKGEQTAHARDGPYWALGNVYAVLLYPAILLLNFALFVIIVTTRHLRRQPWRVLIAHTSFCIFVLAILLYSRLFTEVYSLSSLHTSVICPGVVFLEQTLYFMVMFCLALVAIERLRSLKMDQENGITFRALIITLIVFWVIVFIGPIVSVALPKDQHHNVDTAIISLDVKDDVKICQMRNSMITGIVKLIFEVFALIAIAVVLIAMTMIICKRKRSSKNVQINGSNTKGSSTKGSSAKGSNTKGSNAKGSTDSQEVYEEATTPTTPWFTPLVYGILLICFVILRLVLLSVAEDHDLPAAMYTILLLVWIAFPLTYLVMWCLRGDISCGFDEAQIGEYYLLGDKEAVMGTY